MTAGQKVGDLFLELGMQVDKSSWSKAQKEAYRFHRQMQRHMDSLELPTMKIASFGDAAKKAWAPIAGLATRFAKIGAAAGVAGFGFAVKDALDFDQILTDLEQSSGGAVGDLGKLRKAFLASSTATGVAKEEVAAGVQTYVTLTGDVKTATDSMDLFARVARGQKTDMADVATVAATLGQQFQLSSKDFEQAFSILSSGAKAGSIEFSDMAGLMASLGANFAQFGGSTGTEGVATLGAAFQVAKQSFGTASEAATGLEALMGSVQQHAAKLKKDGKIDVFESDGKTFKPLMQIVDAIGAKDFNGTQLFELLGRKEAVKTLNVLTKQRRLVDDIKDSSRKSSDIQKDFNRRVSAPSERVKTAWNEFKNQIAAAFTPERLEKFALVLEVVLESVIEFGQGFVHWVVEPILDAIQALKDFGNNAVDLAKKFGMNLVSGGTGFLGTSSDVGDAITRINERDAEKKRKGEFGAWHADAQGARIDRLAARGRAILAGDSVPGRPAGSGAMSAQTVINVTGAPGMDPEALASKVMKKFEGYFSQKLREAVVGAGG